MAEMRRFLVPTDRRIVTLQSSGVDVYEDRLIPGLTQAVAKAGRYQQPVDFYDDTVTIRPLTSGIEEHFTLPDGPGQYRVIVTTNLKSRTETARRAMDIIGAENDPTTTRARLAEYDGHEWYGVYFQYLGLILDDADDD